MDVLFLTLIILQRRAHHTPIKSHQDAAVYRLLRRCRVQPEDKTRRKN